MDALLFLNSSSAPVPSNFTLSEDAAAAEVEKLMSAFSTSMLVYREPRSVVLIACYVPLFLLAAVSNALVIYVVTRFHYMRRFMAEKGFPGVIGAIDCTHVKIKAPNLTDRNHPEHLYVNRHGYHSINVQLICDYGLRILNVNAKYPGATHDSFIWRSSSVYEALKENYTAGNRNAWLLGDSGYPLQPWLMTPILNAAPGSPEQRFSDAHAMARNCIERCNGVLKSRFRCLLSERGLHYSPQRASLIINTCAVFHNICKHFNLPDFDVIVANEHNDTDAIENLGQRDDRDNWFNQGINIRNQIIRARFS